MQNYNIDSTYRLLQNNLINYLKTNYFGKNDELRHICSEQFFQEGVLCQHPFIEANPAYVSVLNGIEKSSILTFEKTILESMLKNDLGVRDTPYVHQLQALEEFHKGNDLFVATGTGSGKTECFMWPIATQLVHESISNPNSWQQRGVRVLILYPMNALVADQVGRLRKMMGDQEGRFHAVCRELGNNGRFPQFGMYTGRTPYYGANDHKQNEELSKTLLKDLINISEESRAALKSINKMPAKRDLARFVQQLKDDIHYTDSEDAELITRQEMLLNCPDILITNYSMLQYMLIRSTEQPIWDSTIAWLNQSSDNKILFVIDEAHMYKGAAGGEVALLIRRFMHKLGIGRDRLRFIMTSASIPKDDTEAVAKFACSLSAQQITKNRFQIIIGTEEHIETEKCRTHRAENIVKFYSPDYRSDKDALMNVCVALDFDMADCDFDDEESLAKALGRNLANCRPVMEIAKKCRGNATAFSELAKTAYPEDSEADAEKATSILLFLAVMAKNEKGIPFLPVRLHMFFRGIDGLFACVNPRCPDYKDSIKLGKIYTQHRNTCFCGGKVYEVVNDRTCGALFLKGYYHNDDVSCIWNEIGISDPNSFSSIALYIPLDGENVNMRNRQKAWLNSKTGRIFEGDRYANTPGFIKVIYSTGKATPEQNILRSFLTCPHCSKQKLRLTDFATKGDEPFFHIVSEQFHSQLPVITEESELRKNPNAGRKVLLFSDSRQTAATLARDLTRSADDEAMKKVLPLASVKLEKWADENNEDAALSYLYTVILEYGVESSFRLFYGEDKEHFKTDIDRFKSKAGKYVRKKKPIDYGKLTDRQFKIIPELYSKQLFLQLCSNFRSLTDIGISWIEPVSSELDESMDELYDRKVPITEEQFIAFFSAWANEILTDSYSLDNTVPDSVRESITYDRFGLSEDKVIATKFIKLLENNGFTKKHISEIEKVLSNGYLSPNDENKLYLNTSMISLKTDPSHKWYKCEHCGGIFPFTLFGICARCCKGTPRLMSDADFEGIDFWRKPILDSLSGNTENLTGINTEEHTAQLSHKDQRQEMWSTTEDFENRFQNVYTDKSKDPVDILSCTTTMEVGIDIGSLTAVGLKNIPPMRENYQQRAGRAGRRSSAISTIVTYTGNGPHDSYYFHNPAAIISGNPRSPWIDTNNGKLISRHIAVVCVTELLEKLGCRINELSIDNFFADFYGKFLDKLNGWTLPEQNKAAVLPCADRFDIIEFKCGIINGIERIKKNFEDFPENYKSEKDDYETVLDVFLRKGIFPTYSFPRNVVGFAIEKNGGSAIDQQPDRGLDIAISEYAPGRTIVVNKKTYKSGGIYSFYSKFRSGNWNTPAKPYFESSQYYKPVYICENETCGWFGTDKPINMKCPFCHDNRISEKNMVVPWGFAPRGGRNTSEARVTTDYSYAELPCYSLTPKNEDMITSEKYSNLRYTRQFNQPLIMLNTGVHKDGFIVCKLCGAAVLNNGKEDLSKLPRPYFHPYEKPQRKCSHSENDIMYLGDSFITDIALMEIKIDSQIINTYDRRLWLNSATLTLSEAVLLAAGRVLDIEYSELKSGYRLRNGQDCVYADIYLYDGLSSGAGYSSGVLKKIDKLLDETEKVLSECPSNCEDACHECLCNYHNQRTQHLLNRHYALQLLNWCRYGKLTEPLTVDQQMDELSALSEWIQLDGKYKISYNNNSISICKGEIVKSLFVFPAMWNSQQCDQSENTILIPDILLKKALPESLNIIENAFDDESCL